MTEVKKKWSKLALASFVLSAIYWLFALAQIIYIIMKNPLVLLDKSSFLARYEMIIHITIISLSVLAIVLGIMGIRKIGANSNLLKGYVFVILGIALGAIPLSGWLCSLLCSLFNISIQ
jgi:hypothetical protein